MGIAVQELLANEFFKDFEVIAGRKGLSKEMQGIATLDAPDGFKWTRGKEMVLSSGYVVLQEPGCIEKAFADGTIQRSSGMMLKRDRYLDKIPQNIIKLFDDNELPLILVPFSIPWMDILNQANVAVLNRTIRCFQPQNTQRNGITNQSYKEQKIRRILLNVEREMTFPAYLFDVSEEKNYYSSPNFRRISEQNHLRDEDFWDPRHPHTRHRLCDYINMTRYRLIGSETGDASGVSWIVIPIVLNGVTQAQFVVMESRGGLDYYDEFTIRIAYLMLQSLYEQIGGARDAGYLGFENFIHYALSCDESDIPKMVSQANIQGISMSINYDYVVIRERNNSINVRMQRDLIMKAFAGSSCSRTAKLTILDNKDLLLLVEPKSGARRTSQETKALIEDMDRHMRAAFPEADPAYGICRESKTLTDIRYCVDKCRKVLDMGAILQPKRFIYDYESLGPLTWLQIPEEELDSFLGQYRDLLENEKGREILRTLKVYLESSLNYSATADKLYLHINTVRKRIDKAVEILGVDFDNSAERLKHYILLQYLDV